MDLTKIIAELWRGNRDYKRAIIDLKHKKKYYLRLMNQWKHHIWFRRNVRPSTTAKTTSKIARIAQTIACHACSSLIPNITWFHKYYQEPSVLTCGPGGPQFGLKHWITALYLSVGVMMLKVVLGSPKKEYY